MQPKLTLLTAEDCVVSEWSGGKTTQFAIAPKGAVYQNRDFLWRLSSATVELEESNFTSLPDYTRLVSVLRGGMRIIPQGGDSVNLDAYEVYSFDGETPIHAQGRCTDFNLMLRKNRCEGSLQALRMQPGTLSLSAAVPCPLRYQNRTVAIYCGKGTATVSARDCFSSLSAGQMVLAEDLGRNSLCFSCTQEVVLMIAQIEF